MNTNAGIIEPPAADELTLLTSERRATFKEKMKAVLSKKDLELFAVFSTSVVMLLVLLFWYGVMDPGPFMVRAGDQLIIPEGAATVGGFVPDVLLWVSLMVAGLFALLPSSIALIRSRSVWAISPAVGLITIAISLIAGPMIYSSTVDSHAAVMKEWVNHGYAIELTNEEAEVLLKPGKVLEKDGIELTLAVNESTREARLLDVSETP